MEIDERTYLLAAMDTVGDISEDTIYFSVKIESLEDQMGKSWTEIELIMVRARLDMAKMLTKHPRPGEGIQAHAPPAKSKVRGLLEDFAMLPKEAQQKIAEAASAKTEITTDREGLLTLADLELEDLNEVDWNGDPDDFQRAHHKLTSVLKRIVEVLRIDAKLKPEEPEEESSTDYEATEWYALTEEEREAKILEIPCRPSAGVVSPFCGAGSDTPCRDRRGKKPGAVGKRKFEFCPSRGDRAYAIFTGLKPIHNAS